MSVLTRSSFWVDLAERVGRQAAQVALPIVAVLGTSGSLDVTTALVALGGAVALTILKALAGITVQPDEPLVWRLVDRAVPAAAGVLVGMIPLDLTSLAGVDWKAAGFAAVSAGLTAVIAYWMTPPAAAAVARATPDFPAGDPDLL